MPRIFFIKLLGKNLEVMNSFTIFAVGNSNYLIVRCPILNQEHK